jgi:eukaryotic-like serine/threonine-protein kinase
MLGRYALYEKIASGGMASVHIGRLLGPVGFARTVAVKRLHPQFAENPQFVSMFLDEARLAARIRHPNVVPTLDVVAMANELFLVMEFVQGESLSHLMRAASARGELIPKDMVIAMLVGALHGLHAAHEATSDHGEPLGIVHRDVSPHNILVGTDGVARVLDFGIAKAVGRLHQTTQDGQLKGKLPYMAPEQIGGVVSRATDVYAASVVLWEALAGKPLFRGENGAHVLSQVLKGCDVPPSHHTKGLPPALDEVTMRGLSVDPAMRFATARDMARALEEAIPLATASRIGDWVEIAARATLIERSAKIASIESDSTVQPAPRPPPPAPSSTSGAFRPAVTSSSSFQTVGAAHSGEETSVAVSDDMFLSPQDGAVLSGARRRAAWLASAGAGVVLVLALLVFAPWHSAKPSQAGMTAPSPALPALPTTSTLATNSAPPPAAPDESPSPTAPAPASSVVSAPAVGPAKTTPPAPNRPSPRQPAAPRSSTPACAVMTTYDAQGEPHFKKVCK